MTMINKKTNNNNSYLDSNLQSSKLFKTYQGRKRSSSINQPVGNNIQELKTQQHLSSQSYQSIQMQQSISNSILQSRRSSSVTSSQHVSKRSSISMSNLNLNLQGEKSNQQGVIMEGNYDSQRMDSVVYGESNKQNDKNINGKKINNNHTYQQQQQQPTTITIGSKHTTKLNPSSTIVTSSIISPQQSQSIPQPSPFPTPTILQQSLSKIKRLLIQPYKTVKRHIKQSIFTFTQVQLKQVYQTLSQSLKNLQKLYNIVTINSNSSNSNSGNQNQQQQHFIRNSIQHSRKSIANSEYNNESLCYDAYNNSNNNNNRQLSQTFSYTNRIQQLQQQLQRLKNTHSEQIKQMIRTHQQQIGYVQQQHQQQITSIKQNHLGLLERIKQQCQRRIKQIYKQSEARIKTMQSKLLQEKSIENKLLQEKQHQFQQKITIERQLIEDKYKHLVNRLLQKLTKAKQMYTQLKEENEKIVGESKEMLRKCVEKVMRVKNGESGRFMNIMKERLESMLLLRDDNNVNISSGSNGVVNKYVPYLQEMNRANSNNKVPNPSQPLINMLPITSSATPQHQQQLPFPTSFQCTQTIQQMFLDNNNSSQQRQPLNQYYCVQTMVQKLVQQLVMCGLFRQQNEESVMGLFAIAKQLGISNNNRSINNNNKYGIENYQQQQQQQQQQLQHVVGNANINNNINNSNGLLILGHSLYPIIMERIKLSVSNKYNDSLQQQQQSNNNNNNKNINHNNQHNVSEFSTMSQQNHNHKHNKQQLQQQQRVYCYRNIQSIQQLEVSDSMICDHQQQFIEKQNNNYIYPNRSNTNDNNNEEQYQQQQDQQQQQYYQHQQQQYTANTPNPSYHNQQKQQQLHYGGYESEDSGSFDIELF